MATANGRQVLLGELKLKKKRSTWRNTTPHCQNTGMTPWKRTTICFPGPGLLLPSGPPQVDNIHLMDLPDLVSDRLQHLFHKPGIAQVDISKLEWESANPSLRTLRRLAAGMGMQIKL